MRRWLLLISIAFAGCEGPSIERRLDVRVAGEPVFQNDARCADAYARIQPCYQLSQAHVRTPVDGDGFEVWVGGIPNGFGGKALVLRLEVSQDGRVAAWARIQQWTDQAPATFDPIPIREGWIAPTAASPDPEARQAGRYWLRLDDGVIEGSYDSWGPARADWFAVEELVPIRDEAFRLDYTPPERDGQLTYYLQSIPGLEDGWSPVDPVALLGFRPMPAPNTTQRWAHAFSLLAEPAIATTTYQRPQLTQPVSYVTGQIVSGQYKGGPGELDLPVLLSPGGLTVALRLRRARIEAQISVAGVTSARLGGGIPAQEIDSALLPALRDSIAMTLIAQCSDAPSCPIGSAAELLLDRHDSDGDGTISLDELRGHPLLHPDLDLDDDGTVDALSVGFSFSASPARLDPP